MGVQKRFEMVKSADTRFFPVTYDSYHEWKVRRKLVPSTVYRTNQEAKTYTNHDLCTNRMIGSYRFRM